MLKMHDERIEQAKHQIRSEIALIILFGATISFLIKALAFHMGLKEYLTEYLILIFFPLYQFVRMQTLKISVPTVNTPKQAVKALLTALAIPLVASVIYIGGTQNNSATTNLGGSITYLFLFFLFFIVIFLTANWYSHKKAYQYEMEFDDDSTK